MTLRIERDATGYHIFDSEDLALSLDYREACQVARSLPRMTRPQALRTVAQLLATHGVEGQTARIMVLISELADLVA